MGSIKKLAGQTLWYGVPTIVSRFLNYLLSILLVGIFKPEAFGVITYLYAFIPFLNIIFTYGLETSYFRFSQVSPRQRVYNTLLSSLLVTTVLFTLPLLFFNEPIARFLDIPDKKQFITWVAWIVFFDTLATLPFALLRQLEKPRKFAFIKVVNIVTNIVFTLFFYLVAPRLAGQPFMGWYKPAEVGVGYVLIANLIASMVTVLLLAGEWRIYRPKFSPRLWKQVMQYSLPLVVVGFGGMVNEMLSRFIYLKVSPLPDAVKQHELGVFGANYKLAVLITIFIQIFKMAAEPFFFAQSNQQEAPKTYARVMKFFVLACCLMFLAVALFLDVWKWMITWKNPEYGEGIHIVPILSMASVFLGIYYNLSIWYKLANKNWIGARITLIGAFITIGLNIWWIPHFGYTGSAWATFVCYLYMMVASYWMGKKYYPIPYATKMLVAYIVLAMLMYSVQLGISGWLKPVWVHLLTGSIFMALYLLLIIRTQRRELARLPLVGKWVSKRRASDSKAKA